MNRRDVTIWGPILHFPRSFFLVQPFNVKTAFFEKRSEVGLNFNTKISAF